MITNGGNQGTQRDGSLVQMTQENRPSVFLLALLVHIDTNLVQKYKSVTICVKMTMYAKILHR